MWFTTPLATFVGSNSSYLSVIKFHLGQIGSNFFRVKALGFHHHRELD